MNIASTCKRYKEEKSRQAMRSSYQPGPWEDLRGKTQKQLIRNLTEADTNPNWNLGNGWGEMDRATVYIPFQRQPANSPVWLGWAAGLQGTYPKEASPRYYNHNRHRTPPLGLSDRFPDLGVLMVTQHRQQSSKIHLQLKNYKRKPKTIREDNTLKQ